jgi:hypothetical protein
LPRGLGGVSLATAKRVQNFFDRLQVHGA